jgi:hypothetical protein
VWIVDRYSSSEEHALSLFVTRFVEKAAWVGHPDPVRQAFHFALREAGEEIVEEVLSYQVKLRTKPWEFLDLCLAEMKKRRRQAEAAAPARPHGRQGLLADQRHKENAYLDPAAFKAAIQRIRKQLQPVDDADERK